MYKRILIATDGSDRSPKAIAEGIAVAKAHGAAVVGFHARPPAPPLYYGEVAVMVPRDVTEAFEKESVATAERYVAAIAGAAKQAGVPFTGLQYPSASPADAILETAEKEKCDLIVMASHGRKGLARVVLGSETVKVLTHSRVSVLVTH
ncbi:MAG: universal stress protein [Betaproteobacteria bacterium]|jgi:nucleotide-binding universal stress UspA family protein|nr:universal stress protein [Betaproteobacteria bacterium]